MSSIVWETVKKRQAYKLFNIQSQQYFHSIISVNIISTA
uniref:Uncharacterized protein n=1 Tax=Schistosoma curassoni TaxID=6186 RepID=A0A183KY74_9TREM